MAGSDVAGVRALFESVRYLWRGTRWRRGRERWVPAGVAGSLVGSDGLRSVAEVRAGLVDAVRGTSLSDVQLLVLSEFFGLESYPADLSGGSSSLVGAVPTRRPGVVGVASRSSVAALIDEAVEMVAGVYSPEAAGADVALVPELDPIDRWWLVEPPAAGRRLDSGERARLLESGFVGAFDLVDRAGAARSINDALWRWGHRHLAPDFGARVEGGVRFEHRHAAFAALAVSLWELTSDGEVLDRVLDSSGVVGWVGPAPVAHAARAAEHPRRDEVLSEVTGDELVVLCGEVFERRDGGRAADLVTDVVVSGRHRELLDADAATTVVWALGRGLASVGAWRVVELARWYWLGEPLDLTAVSLVAWSAHVASLHLHDGLAWRLCALADRSGRELHGAGSASDRQLQLVRFQVDLIRSGCRMREGDRFEQADRFDRAGAALRQSVQLVESAQQAWNESREGRVDPTAGLALMLRRMEILFLAGRLRHRGHPVDGISGEFTKVRALSAEVRRILDEFGDDEDDDDRIIGERLDLLDAALAGEPGAELDDSPPPLSPDG